MVRFIANIFIFLLFSTIVSNPLLAKITGLPPYKSIDIPFSEYSNHFDMVVDDNNTIFIASIKGIKVFDGLNWQLVEISSNSNIRRLLYFDGKVFYGGRGIIGYIEKDKYGRYSFTDITPAKQKGKFDSIWHINHCGDSIYFQDIYDVFAYNLKTKSKINWHFTTKLGATICYQSKLVLQVRGEGLKELKNNQWVESSLLLDSSDLIYEFAQIDKDKIFILPDSNDWKIFNKGEIQKLTFDKQLPHLLNYVSIAVLERGKFVLGSNNGLLTFLDIKTHQAESFHLDNKWISELIFKNGRLLALTEFKIYSIEWPTPFRVFNQESGISSNVYRVQDWNNTLYILSSSGAFFEDQQQNVYQHKLIKRLNWTNKEAWDLLPLNENQALLAESHRILLVNKDHEQEPKIIGDVVYPREFFSSKYTKNLTFVISEFDLYMLKNEGQNWKIRKIYAKRPLSIVEPSAGKLLLSFANSPPQILNFDEKTGKTMETSKQTLNLEEIKNLESINFFSNNTNDIFAFSQNKIYKIINNKFEKYHIPEITNNFNNAEIVSIKQSNQGDFFGFTSTKFFRKFKSNKLEVVDIKPYLKGIINGVKEINGIFIIFTHGKIISYNPLIKYAKEKYNTYSLNLKSILFNNKQEKKRLPLKSTKTQRFEQNTGSIIINFAVNDLFNQENYQYQYRLLGFDDNWSSEFGDKQISFSKLPVGNYRLELKANDNFGNIYKNNQFQFEIFPKWYNTNWARIIWLLLALLILALILRTIIRWRERIFQKQKLALEEIIANKTIALQQANTELTKIANQDGLTGLSNRYYMEKYCKKIADNGYEKVVVMMLDMDFFKNYNDKYGHIAGDKLLKKLANILQKEVNFEQALIARYGGEEFLIIVCQQSLNICIEKAEEIRKLIENPKKKISISIGISSSMENKPVSCFEQIQQLIKRADLALYKAKESGRNQIKIAKYP